MRRRSLTKQAARVVNHMIDEHGMTVTQVAEICGVHKSFISRCKNGQREFGPGQIEKLADHLGIPTGAMLLAMHPPKPDHPDPRVNEARRLCREVILQCDKLEAACNTELAKEAADEKSATDKGLKRTA